MAKRKRRTKDDKDENVIVSHSVYIGDDDDFSEFIQSPREVKAAKPCQEVVANKKIPQLPNEIIDRIVFFMVSASGMNRAFVILEKRRRQLPRNTRAKETYSTPTSPLSYTSVLFVSKAFFHAGLRAFYGTNTLLFKEKSQLAEFINDTSEGRRKFVRRVAFAIDYYRNRDLASLESSTKTSVIARIRKIFKDDFETIGQGFPKVTKFLVSLAYARGPFVPRASYPPDFPLEGQFQWQSSTDPNQSLIISWDHESTRRVTASTE